MTSLEVVVEEEVDQDSRLGRRDFPSDSAQSLACTDGQTGLWSGRRPRIPGCRRAGKSASERWRRVRKAVEDLRWRRLKTAEDDLGGVDGWWSLERRRRRRRRGVERR